MNGFSYDARYDQNGMAQQDVVDAENMMMLGQDDMSGMGGGQSLDDIVNQNAKVIRRQSMPQGYGTSQNSLDTGNLNRLSMGDFGGASGNLRNFNFDPNVTLDGSVNQRGYSSRASTGDLALQTSFGNTTPYAGMAQNSASAYASPAHPSASIDMNSPFLDSNMGAQMDFSVEGNLGNLGNDSMNMNMYNNSFANNALASPMQNKVSQGTPTRQDSGSGINSGMGSQYSRRSDQPSTAKRAQNHRPDAASPLHRDMSQTTGFDTPESTSRQHLHSGFPSQPQHPPAGSAQDIGMHRNRQTYDGVNGPVPVNADNHNPNNQGFQWENPEGGWPSTLVGRPHMQSTFKNVYSSTGFDMLGVLVSH